MVTQKVTAAKDEAIQAISGWAGRALEHRQMSAAAWAKGAGIKGTTITRGMSPNSNGTTKVENLHLLAREMGIPSVLDLLNSQFTGTSTESGACYWTPSEETIVQILEVVLHAVPASHVRVNDIPVVAHGLALALADFAVQPAKEHDPGFRDGVLTPLARALRNYKQQRVAAV